MKPVIYGVLSYIIIVILLIFVLPSDVDAYNGSCEYYLNEAKKYEIISKKQNDKNIQDKYKNITKKYLSQYYECLEHDSRKVSSPYKGYR